MNHHFSSRSTGRSRGRGFTLIELLVVIAIIAILAAILFPVFARARENARRSACQSNLKQIGLGIMQYSQDYDEAYPMSVWQNVTANAALGIPMTWRDEIYPYMKSAQIFACPSYAKNKNLVWNTILNIPVSYMCNGSLFQYNIVSGVGWFPAKLSQIDQPSQVVMVGEDGVADRGDAVAGRWDQNNTNDEWFNVLHLGTMNMLFADGHVKSMSLTRSVTPTNYWSIPGSNYSFQVAQSQYEATAQVMDAVHQ